MNTTMITETLNIASIVMTAIGGISSVLVLTYMTLNIRKIWS